MQDFQRKKDINLLSNTFTQKDNSFLYLDQSKNLYDFALKHDSQIKRMENEITNLKSQIIDLSMKISLNSSNNNNNNNIINIDENNNNNNYYLNQIFKLKEDIKNDLMKDINNIIISQNNEFKEKFQNLKEEIELYNDEKNNNNKIIEINDNLETLNQQLIMKDNEKNNLENIILNKINTNKVEINNTTNEIFKRIDNLDTDFDRLVQSLKNQFLTNANTITQLENTKVNINDYQKQINLVNKNIDDLNNKINEYNLFNKNNIFNKSSLLNIKNGKDEFEIKNELTLFKNEIYNDIEKINLKILNELRNQADDIKTIYQKMNTTDNNYIKNKQRDINFESPRNLLFNSFSPISMEKSENQQLNIISLMEKELSKKANLDQLNFALETQSKLNEAFSSASRISRFCWDSEGVLKDNKFIIWSIQNINTALDVFKWENNSENITILQNGVYKIVIGLIGMEKNKNFGIIFNDDENIIVDSKNNYDLNENQNENDIINDKGNIKFMEKYIACVENTKIKAILFDNSNDYNDDNSEEAFLEIIKII